MKPYDPIELESVPYVGSVAQNYEAMLDMKRRKLVKELEAQILVESVLRRPTE